MSTSTPQPQTNGVAPSASQPGTSTQPPNSSQTSQPSQQTTTTAVVPSQSQSQPQSQPQTQQTVQQQQIHHQQPPTSPSATAPRPRDARTIELLLTAQGVTSFEQRVPLLLLDFAYRHTSAVLSDALQLSADPYTSHAGARPSASSGAAPVNVGDANVSANAVQIAIASRLGYQFHGGSGSGGISKDWMLDIARERNRVALPRLTAADWGVRLPGEKFVLNGLSWGLRDYWAGQDDMEDGGSDDEDDEMEFENALAKGEAMEGIETEDVGGDGVEGGTMDDVFGDEQLEDEEMEEV
ncbi:transcription initiation factor IID, 31kD subunit-domain-containing protein [Apodospora peruviana]|uniref:Transcription initiation factor IID, 31kD subunit-domain-containing protein n=1 Tax=Apodospora peruviana TaxID=516989 RepID=A0AAE0IS17_9PEZI|nr:transcription initiation factor IID, 31kD subunit-domain-containing protein [Apodospora peruviana]